MTNRSASFSAAFILASLLVFMIGCGTQQQSSNAARVPLVQDWSTNHWFYPSPGSVVDPSKISDPRMLNSWLKTHPAWTQARRSALEQGLHGGPEWNVLVGNHNSSRIDWAVSLGQNGGMPIGEFPAKFSFDINAMPDCINDYVVYVINAAPAASTQANIIAFNNLYSGAGASLCGMTGPTTMWSYAIGTGTVTTSPTPSLDGKKIAFIDNELRGQFNVLTWATGPGQGTDATTGSVAPNGASSVFTLDFTNLSGNPNCLVSNSTATNASPFIDYANDVAYLATDNGSLYKITGVFNGTPAVAYCTPVNLGKAMTSPVWDFVSGTVLVSDGQLLYAFTPGATAFIPVAAPVTLGSLTAHTINLSPMVDALNGWAYTFGGEDLTNTSAFVAQVKVDLSSSSVGFMGPATTSLYILDGQFDNRYYTGGPTAANATLYACGTQAASGGNDPSLYSFNFSGAGVMNTTPLMADNNRITTGAAPGTCSPLLEVDDGTHDRLFVGVSGSDRVTMWGIGPQLTSSSTPQATAKFQTGGTSGFSVDNIDLLDPETANIYFGTLAPGTIQCGTGNYCAVKLTQVLGP